jgi:hypothetical protein
MSRGGHVAGDVEHLFLQDTISRGGQVTGVGHLWLQDNTQGACVKTSTATTHHHVQDPSALLHIPWTGEKK